MHNITITLEEPIAAWLRLAAAKHGLSVSRFVGDLVQERMRDGREYDEAMRQFFAEKPYHFGWADGRAPNREEIHDRASGRGELAREASIRKEPK